MKTDFLKSYVDVTATFCFSYFSSILSAKLSIHLYSLQYVSPEIKIACYESFLSLPCF